ncbi:MAG: hypothetical protein M1817_000465 [Caeruleum heppii]|nr:MAG: hypothetical protein M1817_000465 [Caeruleum heppii]
MGDSYGAAIGVGIVGQDAGAGECSQYDAGYSSIVEPFFVGGNYVGFADVLKTCIFLPAKKDACDEALTEAEAKIDNDLEKNIYDLLFAVLPKASRDGFMVWTLYAKFFDEEPCECDQESWCFFSLGVVGCLKLDVSLRQRFNWHKFGGTYQDDKYGLMSITPEVNPDTLHANAKEFCKEIGGKGFAPKTRRTLLYSKDSISAVNIGFDWLLPASGSARVKVSEEDCNECLNVFIDGCAGSKDNPLNWKYGGDYTVDEIQERIGVVGKLDHAVPALVKPIAKCDSLYQVARDEFWIYGAGFLSVDSGLDLFNQMSHCIGSSVTDWKSTYYDERDMDGFEWVAFGHTPIWQKHCFTPVIEGSGGPDVPCNGLG